MKHADKVPASSRAEGPLPYVTLSVAASLDGFIDHQGENRIVLSSPENLAAIDRLRAESDAILIGAGTLRRDNPKLLVKAQDLRQERVGKGLKDQPAKVLMAGRSPVQMSNQFFVKGDSTKIVFCAKDTEFIGDASGVEILRHSGDSFPLNEALSVLHARGLSRILVEGGTRISTALLEERLVNEFWLTIAPITLASFGGAKIVAKQLDLSWLAIKEISNQGGCVLVKYGAG